MKSHEAEGVRASVNPSQQPSSSGRTIAITIPIPDRVENFSDLAPLFAVLGERAAELPPSYTRACARFVEDRLSDALNALLLCRGSGPWSKELTAVNNLGCAVLRLEQETRGALTEARVMLYKEVAE
jgi:hypothetical protein